MWCSLCRADVSVRTTGQAGGLLCSRCGHDLLTPTRPTDAIRQAREILERWNSSDLFERISRTESLDSLGTRIDLVKPTATRNYDLPGQTLESATPKNSRPTILDATSDRAPNNQVLEQLPSEQRPSERLPAENDVTEQPAAEQPAAEQPIAEQPIAEQLVQGALEGDEQSIQVSNASTATHSTNPDVLPVNEPIDRQKAAAAVAAQVADRELDLSVLAAVDILDLTTVADSEVSDAGVTPELQRVMELARAKEFELQQLQMSPLIDNAASTAEQEPEAPADEATHLAGSIQSKPATDELSHADSELSRGEPAETANVSEFLPVPVPKKITRNSMRRPPLHRRFQLDHPTTLSSAGSENVNRNLRVDQPGGNDDVAAAAGQGGSVTSSVAPETKIVSNSAASGRRFRFDTAEPVDRVTGTDGRRGRTQTLPKHRYIDDAHDTGMRGPHFEVTAPRRSNLTSATGQFLAYLGVLGLTIGTAMVIYGHFGGYSEYTPTGWLVTTVAQMLLFLGVINLVSGGIEQNNDDVSRRINTLGEQLFRIEQVTSNAMRGPKLPAHLYDNPNAEIQEESRETVGGRRE